MDCGETKAAKSFDRTVIRFWSKVRKSTQWCWLWQASYSPDGYGLFRFRGAMQLAHRVVWILVYGEIPDGKEVCHSCDTPCCVRPSHLFLGTHAQNMADMVAKGRARSGGARGSKHRSVTCPESVAKGDEHWSRRCPEKRASGERHGMAKLTTQKVKHIRKLFASGVRQTKIAEKFYISHQLVSMIVRGLIWK